MTKYCKWLEDSDGNYETECGNAWLMFVFACDTPENNGMKYCLYCGKELWQVDCSKEDETN